MSTANAPATRRPAERFYDVVVVGAGVGGLVAARECLGAGLSVKLLESRERVGGRLRAVRASGGGVLELGGEFFRPAVSPHLAAELELYGIGTAPAYAGDRQLVFADGRLHDLSETFEAHRESRRELVQTVRREALRLQSEAGRSVLEGTSVAVLLRGLSLPPLVMTWLRGWIENYSGTSLERISAASMLALVASSGGSLRSAAVTSGDRLLESTGALTEGLRHSVRHALELGQPVREVSRSRDRNFLVRTESHSFTARSVVVAAPRNVIAKGGLIIDVDWDGSSPRALRKPHPGLGCKVNARLDRQAPPRTMILGQMGGFRSMFIRDRLDDGSVWATLFGSEDTMGPNRPSLDDAVRASVGEVWGGGVQVLETAYQDWTNDPNAYGAWTVAPVGESDSLTELAARSPRGLVFCGADYWPLRKGVESALESAFAAAATITSYLGDREKDEDV